MRDDDLRSFGRTLGSAILGIGLGLAVLGIGFAVSRYVLPDNVVVAATSAPQARSAAPTTGTGTPAPARTTAAPTVEPSPTKDPMVVSAFQGQGLRLAALALPPGYTLTAPIGGRVSIVVYQFIDGQIRSGANLADQPSYPYVFIRSADREVKLRPGAVDTDVQLLVKDGDIVTAGTPLLRTLTAGASSWATFYDRTVTAQVVASATVLPSGAETDPVALFAKRP